MSRLEIPRELWSKAESLSPLGLEERAWHPDDAAKVLDLLHGTEISVLGGDIYVRRAGRFEPSYENWYAERGPDETVAAFANRSQTIAREHLQALSTSGVDGRWVTLVLSEVMEPSDEE